ncbi:hypothetical protein BIV24_24850 [Streptomyces colonosanans]|uniref:Uncharacterized protein n=2 Tax=Streptomyces colonosanans TaxID=1428652 RepID=A0A1S2P1T8_9ACTN|nr:hypothetical protein BIV24_24850 [Streptomyces colonosanans]
MVLHLAELHSSPGDPSLATMNCFSEVAKQYPSATSFTARQPALLVGGIVDGAGLDDLADVAWRARMEGLRHRAFYVISGFTNPAGESRSAGTTFTVQRKWLST